MAIVIGGLLQQDDPFERSKLVRLDQVAASLVGADGAHRGTVLFVDPDDACEAGDLDPLQDGPGRVGPLVLDLDIDDGSAEGLDALLRRTEVEASTRGWRWHTYCSGTGYHVEVDPVTVEQGQRRWWLPQAWSNYRVVRDFSEAVGGISGLGATHPPGIDRMKSHLRMAGSVNPKSLATTRKVPLEHSGKAAP